MSDLSSLIQTILSVPESHRFMRSALADFTAGGELLFREEVGGSRFADQLALLAGR